MPGAHRLRGKRKAPWPYYIPTHWGQAQLTGIGGLTAVPEGLYGPTNEAPWVRANAVPQAVTEPVGTHVTVAPGQLTQSLLDANPGATFWLTAGLHSLTWYIAPTTGQKFYLQSPAGIARTTADTAVIDGGNGSLNALFISAAQGVEIHGGLWRNQGNASSADWATAILASGGYAVTTGWLIEDACVGPNYNRNVHIQASNSTVRRCYLFNGGRYNLTCSQSVMGDPEHSGILIEHNHLYNGNTRMLEPAHDAGSTKFTKGGDIIVRYNWVEAGYGYGIWFERVTTNGRIEENVSENHTRSGIRYEVESGPTLITGGKILHNALYNNGRSGFSFENDAQIIVSECDASATYEVEIAYNLLDTAYGMLVGLSSYDGFAENTKNMHVHDNDIWARHASCRMGGTDIGATKTMWTSNNRWEDNHYHVLSADTAHWYWDSGTGPGVSKTWAQWQAYGHDVGVTRELI